MPGVLITFEGGEGAGKSTLAQSTYERLHAMGLPVILTREPGGTALGEELRALLLQHRTHPLSPRAELFLFLAARAEHVDTVIKPHLDKGAIVLCDRFADSTIAYQGAGRKICKEYVVACCEKVTLDIVPTLTLYVDIDPEIGLRRAKKRSASDRIESEALTFHKRVRETFLALAGQHPKRIVVCDGNLSKEALFDQAWLSIMRILGR